MSKIRLNERLFMVITGLIFGLPAIAHGIAEKKYNEAVLGVGLIVIAVILALHLLKPKSQDKE